LIAHDKLDPVISRIINNESMPSSPFNKLSTLYSPDLILLEFQ